MKSLLLLILGLIPFLGLGIGCNDVCSQETLAPTFSPCASATDPANPVETPTAGLLTPSASTAPSDSPQLTPCSDHDADSFSIEDGDCNDGDANVYPGAIEVPADNIDQDCSGVDSTIVSLTQPLALIQGNNSNGYFGTPVRRLRDLNGDGIDEISSAAILASVEDVGELAGQLTIFFSPFSPSLMPAKSALFVGATSYEVAGSAVGTGDLNCGGCSDLAISAVAHDGDRGAVYIFWGEVQPGICRTFEQDQSLDEASMVILGSLPGDTFGDSIAMGHDLNGDQCEDLVVGASNASPGGISYSGSIAVFLGSQSYTEASIQADQAALTVYGTGESAWFGSSVSMDSDLNGDGAKDLVVAAPGLEMPDPPGQYSFARDGAVYVLLSVTSASTTSFPRGHMNAEVMDWRLEAPGDGGLFGETIATGSDMDSDGIDDIAVSAPNESTLFYSTSGEGYHNGSIYLFSGQSLATAFASAKRLSALTVPSWRWAGTYPYQGLGEGLALTEDITGDRDACADLLLGTGDSSFQPNSNMGNSFVVAGETLGPPGQELQFIDKYSAFIAWTEESPGDRAGYSLDSLPGGEAVLIGAPDYSYPNCSYCGAVYVMPTTRYSP